MPSPSPKKGISCGILIAFLLNGCCLKVFHGNWRYTAEIGGVARLSAERVEPPEHLSDQPVLIER